MANPVILETHGGIGRIYSECYQALPGCVFEKNPTKTAILVLQRPLWPVYEMPCELGLAIGLPTHLQPNFYDLDPYGDPWSVIKLVLRRIDRESWIVVNDGLRNKAKTGSLWQVKSVAGMVQHFGSNIYHRYLDGCEWFLNALCVDSRLKLGSFYGRYATANITHYAARVTPAIDSDTSRSDIPLAGMVGGLS